MNHSACALQLMMLVCGAGTPWATGCAPSTDTGPVVTTDAGSDAADAASPSDTAVAVETALDTAIGGTDVGSMETAPDVAEVAVMDAPPISDVGSDAMTDIKPLYTICAPPSGGTCPEDCEKVLGHPMRDSIPSCAEMAELLFCVDYKFVTAVVKCRVRLSTGRIYLFPSWAPEDGDSADWRTCTKEEHDKSPATFCK